MYISGDADEITFDPDDVITNIEMVSELHRVYSFSYFKYGIYKSREVKKNLIKKRVAARVSLSDFFYLPRFINPIFKIGEMNKLYITCISPQ